MVLTFAATVLLSPLQRRRGLLLILAFGVALCLWQLGESGLVDETPPLFAAAGRAMSTTGDWLTRGLMVCLASTSLLWCIG